MSLLLYTSIYFGIFAIFKHYIDVWEKPSRHLPVVDIFEVDYDAMIASVLSDANFPKDNIILDLPGFKKDPSLRISHRFSREIVFNPSTRQVIKDEGKSSDLGMFLNGLHYGRPLKKTGYYIFGGVAVGVMFLVVGGVILLIIGKFNDSGKNPQSVFSIWHRKIFIWGFPIFILIVLCGSVMCLSFDSADPMVFITTNGEKSDIRPVIGPVLFPEDKPVAKSNKTVLMLPVRDLIRKAQMINSQIRFQRLTLINWTDETAKIKLVGYNPWKPFLNGVINRPTIILNARNGSLIVQSKVLDRSWAVLLPEFIYFIHFLFGVGIFTRLLIAGLMAACCLAIGFGVMIWLEKRARKFGDSVPFYHWMGKFSLTVMIGVIPATGLLFVLQWLLPFELENRLSWQQGAFFNFWLATLTWSFYRINSYKASKEFLALGSLFFLCAPIFHFIQSGFSPRALIQNGMLNILSVDAGLALFGLLLLISVFKLPANRKEAKQFWSKNKRG